MAKQSVEQALQRLREVRKELDQIEKTLSAALGEKKRSRKSTGIPYCHTQSLEKFESICLDLPAYQHNYRCVHQELMKRKAANPDGYAWAPKNVATFAQYVRAARRAKRR